MNKKDVITLDNNKDYLILDKIVIDDKNYLYTVVVDKDDIPSNEYKFFLISGDDELTEVLDTEVLAKLLNEVALNLDNNSFNN